MSKLAFQAQTGLIATGTSAKTLLQIKAATNQKVAINEWSVSFAGVTNTDAPIRVDLIRQSTAGTMSSLTLTKANVDDSETLQTTAQHTATVEPTTTEIIRTEFVHPQGGYTWQAPFGQHILLEGNGYIGLVVTSSVSVNATASFSCEE